MSQYIIKEKDWKTVLDKAAFKEEDWIYINKITDTIYSHPYNPQAEREKLLDEVIVLLNKVYEQKYDPRPCNRTDDGGMYNDRELDLILEIQDMIKHIQNEGK